MKFLKLIMIAVLFFLISSGCATTSKTATTVDSQKNEQDEIRKQSQKNIDDLKNTK